ncbi:hypothetical protein SCLCIDRAFT_1206832 [Scleroderma citrinum Foug A]|uniref:Uncharacterized protein n=1 Tax=Scleroderma citrinum Foug A TaxID=1036808 RepID=A0A0C3ERE1_9AGAM|nr:hypothetical protein SCLCIDRAFT_1206832 [Scleroderma citrinum Foug A]
MIHGLRKRIEGWHASDMHGQAYPLNLVTPRLQPHLTHTHMDIKSRFSPTQRQHSSGHHSCDLVDRRMPHPVYESRDNAHPDDITSRTWDFCHNVSRQSYYQGAISIHLQHFVHNSS